MAKHSLPLISTGPSRTALEIPKASNDCGTCTCCCDVMGVVDLQKPHFARCQHLGEGCCRIYADRPAGCATYRCVWHLGFLGDRPDWRPDKLGLLIELHGQGHGTIIDVYETRPGALAENEQRLRPLLQRLRSHRSLKKAVYARPWLRLIPFGADIPVDFPISPLWSYHTPATGPAPLIPHTRPDEAIYNGPCHDLLMPHAEKPADPSDSPTP